MESSKESIRQVFNSFDKDNSGFIDFDEIIKVAQELGQQISTAEVKKIFSDVDTNKDNKISFEEFYTWWQYGRDNKLETLVALQLKALNLLSKAKVHFHKISSLILGNTSSNFDSYSLRLAVGSPENTKSAINLKVIVGSGQADFSSQILKGLNIGIDVPAIVYRTKSNTPQESKDKLQGLIENALEMAKMMIPDENITSMLDLLKTSFGVDGEYVVFGISFDHPLLTTVLERYLEVLSLYLGNEFKGEFEADFGLNFDFNSFFDNKEKKLTEVIGKGFHVNLGLKVSQNFQENFVNYYTSIAEGFIANNQESKAARYISKYAFLFLLKSFNMEIITKDFEDLQTKVAGTAVEKFLVPQKTIEELLTNAKSGAPPISEIAAEMPLVSEVADFLKSLKGEGSITVQLPRVCLHVNMQSSGHTKLIDFFM